MLFKKKIHTTILLLIFILSLSACASKKGTELHSPYLTKIEQILITSGSNKKQIQNFLSSHKTNPEKQQAAQFIVANLPLSDRASLSAELLNENLEYAFLARESTRWGNEVSWSDFKHYVLPHRVSQEQAVRWRKQFYNELLPIVSKCKTMEEAVLAVNLWCFSKTGFKSTQRWDQNPLMTINRGWGRCEEAVILTVSAMRSIGIPARQAMVPAWQHSNDNHTWTEVQVNGKWKYLESANPDYGLNHAWFTGSARKAPLVISYAYGQVNQPQSPVLGRPFGCTQINTTKTYAPASRSKIFVTDENNTPLSDIKIFISVFNYASFRPIVTKTTDKNGQAEILLGPGSVLVSAAENNKSAYVASSWIPGKQEKRNNILLKLTPDNLPEGQIFFPFAYSDSMAKTAPPKNSEGTQKAEFDSIKEDRLNTFSNLKIGAGIFNPALAEFITKAGLNSPEIMTAIDNYPAANHKDLISNIKMMPTADLISISQKDLVENVVTASIARKEAKENGLTYDSEIYDEYVLNSRILYEQLSPWRKTLHAEFNFTDTNKIYRLVKKINQFTAKIKTTPRGPLGNGNTPLGIFNSRIASSEYEIGIFATAALRSAGIPARYLEEQGWVEFYNGTDWRPFYPRHPEFIENKNATSGSKAFYNDWISVKFSLPGFPQGTKPPQYFKDFTVSELSEHSYFSIIEKTIRGKMDAKSNIWEINVPNKDLYLIGAKRNNKNEPVISVINIKKINHNSSK